MELGAPGVGGPGAIVPEGFAVRPAEDADAGAVIDLYRACWGEYHDMVLDTDHEMAHLHRVASHYAALGGDAWVVVPADGSLSCPVAGSAAFRPVEGGRACELQMVYVMPRARRRGIASFLVRMVQDRIAASGCREMELWSDVRFTDAHRLYKSLGWTQLDETRYVDDLSKSTEYHFVRSLPAG